MSRRARYTSAEDHALQAFIESNKYKYPVTGNKLWLFAEAQRVTSHSWQLMKARYMLLSGVSAKKGKKKHLLRPSLGSGAPGTIPFRLSFTCTSTCPTSTHPTSTLTTSTCTTSTRPTSTHSLTSTVPRRVTLTDATTHRRYGDGQRQGWHPPVLPCHAVQAGGCQHPNRASAIPTQTFTFILDMHALCITIRIIRTSYAHTFSL